MKTKLLKKLRTEAYQVYGIKYFLKISAGGGVYVIGMRDFNKEDVAEYTLKSARNRLAEMRNAYCRGRVRELRLNSGMFKFRKL